MLALVWDHALMTFFLFFAEYRVFEFSKRFILLSSFSYSIMTDYLGILWIVWVIIIIIAILLAIRRARRAIDSTLNLDCWMYKEHTFFWLITLCPFTDRNATQPAAYTVYSPPGSYPPHYVVGNNSTDQPHPLSSMYYGAPYPEAPLRNNATPSSSAYQKPDSSSVIDIPPPSYQDHSKDQRLPKPIWKLRTLGALQSIFL